MAAIQIRVGASLDRSTATIFQQLAENAKRANRAIADEARKAAKEEEKVWKDAQRELARMEREATNQRKKAAKEAENAAKVAAREEERVARDKVQAMIRIDKELTRSREREAKERARAEERAANDSARAWVKSEEKRRRDVAAVKRGHGQQIEKLAGMGSSAMLGAGRFGLSMLSDMAQGAGVRLDMASHFSNASDLQDRATQLANAGYMPGTVGANGRRQDPRELMAQSYQVGNATGTAANEVMGGLQAFVGKTGDLEAARSVIGDLAKLSKATGSNLEDMSNAAADVSNQLGDIPDKGARIKDVMMAIAGQGKLGAVEIKDLASQMAKIAANAQLVEGDAGENIKTFGAIAQMSRAHGGAASATQAATSVASMMDVFSKGARLDAFHNLGVKTASTASPGKLRNVEEIIIDTLVATQRKGGGDTDKVNKLFGSTFATAQSRRAVKGLESTFRTTYGSAKGTEEEKLATATKAVREEFDQLKKVAMAETELSDSFANSLSTGKSQAEIFNNQMQQIAQDAQTKLGPALLALAPVIIDVTKKFADFAVNVLGLAPKPQADIENEVAGAKKDVTAADTILAKPGSVTPEQAKQLRLTLQARKDALAKKQTDTKSQIKQAENTGGFFSNTAHELYGGVLDDAKNGNYGRLALTANPFGALGRSAYSAYKAMSGTTSRQTETGKNIQAAVSASGDAGDEGKKIDEQLKKLDAIDKTLGTKTLKVEVVNLRSGATGGGQNRGLEPTE